MKKIMLFFCLLLAGIPLVQAQKSVILSSPLVLVEYQVISLSPNGKWACGNINDGYSRGFRWDLTTGEVLELSPMGSNSTALCVANDGTVAGTFMDDEALPNHATIECAGYWRAGRWHHVGNGFIDPVQSERDGTVAYAISPNAKYLGGLALIDNCYTPVAWNLETGEMTKYFIHKNANGQGAGSIFAITDDGVAAGYSYHPVKMNRTPTIWTTPTDTLLPAYEMVGPFCSAGHISSDGTKVLCYDRVVDLSTPEHKATKVASFDNLFSFEFFTVNNNGIVGGYTQTGMMDASSATFIKDGQMVSAASYLEGLGVDLSNYLAVVRAYGISDDEKTFALMAYDKDEVIRSIVVKLDQNTTNPAPVGLRAHALSGIGGVELTWRAPIGAETLPVGYNVLRNGVKVNTATVTDLHYVDQNLADGNYTYTVQAVYAQQSSEASQPATVALAAVPATAPANLQAVQRGLNNVQLTWEKPQFPMPSYGYADETVDMYQMGGGQYAYESGVRFRASLLKAYADKGMVISDVCFYPMSKETTWKINFYAPDDTDNPLYTETIDGKNLVYGQKNRVHLTTPYAIPAGQDVVVGVEVSADYGTYTTQGFTYGTCIPGYTDLMRRTSLSTGKEAFFSLYQSRQDNENGATMYEMTWPISLMFSSANATADDWKHYNLYADGTQVGTIEADGHLLTQVPDGTHTYEVSAVSQQGIETPKATTQLEVKTNTALYKPQNVQVTMNGKRMNATWSDLSADNNRTVLTYASDNCANGVVGSASQNYSYMVKTVYSGSKIRNLDGYVVDAFRFYPTANADFTFYLYVDGRMHTDLYVENYTLNQWNEVKLPTPIVIDRNSSYDLILDCYDVDEEKAPIGMDDQLAHQGVSDLYSIDEGSNFNSLVAEGGTNANWMIGMSVVTEQSTALPLQGYNVTIDGTQANDALLTEPSFSRQFTEAENGTHVFRVSAVYDGSIGTQRSSFIYFTVNIATGIADATAADATLQVQRGASVLRVTGGEVASLSLYDAAGRRVAAAKGSEVGISGNPAGTYVLRITLTDGSTLSRKLQF